MGVLRFVVGLVVTGVAAAVFVLASIAFYRQWRRNRREDW